MTTPPLDEETIRNMIANPQPWNQGLALPPVTLPQAAPRTNELGAKLDRTNELGDTLPPTPETVPEAQPPAQRGTLQGDKNEQARLRQTGSGISQISSKIQGTQFGQNHPTLSKILGGAAQGIATLGDVGLSAVAPSLAINLPGTAYHHRMLENSANKAVTGDEANAEKEAQTGSVQANTEHAQAETAGMPQAEADRHALTQAQIDKDEQDKVKSLQQLHAEAVQKAIAEGRDPHEDKNVQQYADAIVGLQPGQNKEDGAPKTIQIEVNGKPHQMAWNPATKKYDLDQGLSGEKPTQAPGITMIVPNGEGGGTVQRLTPGQTVAPGALTAGGLSSTTTNAGKETTKEATAAKSIVDEVEMAHTLAKEAEAGNAPADVDLALSFFKTIKGSGTGIRFTQQEQNLIRGSRSTAGDLEGVAQKVIGGGQMFTPDQRKNILKVMDIHAEQAKNHTGGSGVSSGGGAAKPKWNPVTGRYE